MNLIKNEKREMPILPSKPDWSLPKLPVTPALPEAPVWDDQQLVGSKVEASAVPTDWLQFLSEVPSVFVDETAFQLHEEVIALDVDGQREVLTSSASDVGISVISSPTKEQDAIAIEPQESVISIVVGDGVSNSAVPEVAVRLAVRSAIIALRKETIGTGIIEQANDAIQEGSVAELAYSRVAMLEGKAHDAKNTSDNMLAITYDALVTKYQEYIDSKKIASAMLLVAQYDEQTGRLDFINRGDTRVVVIKSDGSHQIYEGEEQDGLLYDPNCEITNQEEIRETVQLGMSDVALLESDGSQKIDGVLGKIASLVKHSQNSSRLDVDIVDLIKNELSSDPDDDLTTVVIHRK